MKEQKNEDEKRLGAERRLRERQAGWHGVGYEHSRHAESNIKMPPFDGLSGVVGEGFGGWKGEIFEYWESQRVHF